MAERLKSKLLEDDRLSDLVAGPDAYRDLPSLLSACRSSPSQTAINVQLSIDETYGDISPIRIPLTPHNTHHQPSPNISAYLSIMRGCNNMCAFCIVPFTRGRERSRSFESIRREICELRDAGYREVVLLGQNVNSFLDSTAESVWEGLSAQNAMSANFRTIYKPNLSEGVRFAELLDRISDAVPEMRIRFTSPHPKDFPDALLHVMASKPNICKSIHMPAQSGSSAVLEQMRRGYTREAYLDLVRNIRSIVPGVSLSSDFISGFCGETEEDHQQTLSLLREVQYDQAFMFAYSMREKTSAHRNLVDDVPEDVKLRRLREVIDTFHEVSLKKNEREEIGRVHIALIDKESRKSNNSWAGRTDSNKRIVFAKRKLPIATPSRPIINSNNDGVSGGAGERFGEQEREPTFGDFVLVKVTSVSSLTLRAEPLAIMQGPN
eukprot:c7406_g1_i2.p1 GENE.c7406_g1_i2~~c7406_g1_i2.p1  ORF type:complete len:436 (-),score=104.91 c7406_g1_i2:52-1359(-)